MQLLLPMAVKTAKADANTSGKGGIAHVRWEVSERKCGSQKMHADPDDKRRRARAATLAGGAHGT